MKSSVTAPKVPNPVQQYATLLKDRRILSLSPEDARAYYHMRLVQQRQPLPRASSRGVKQSREDIVVEAYLHTLCQRHRIAPRTPVELDPETRARIYKFYLAGVLPIRLGGINL